MVRTPGWDKWWCQEGTRVFESGQKLRHLYEWSEKGEPPRLCAVHLPPPTATGPLSLDWLTLLPLLDAEEEAEEHEAEQGTGKGKEKGKGKRWGRASSRRNRSTPGLEGLERSNVVDDDEEGPPLTKNQRWRRRMNLHLFGHRVFTIFELL